LQKTRQLRHGLLSRFLEAKCKAFHYEPPPNIFVSSSGLQLGDEWLDKIRVALKSAKIVIALFSPEAVSRPWVNFEAGGAWFSSEKTLIPLCIGGLTPATLPKPYSNIQGADLHDSSTPYYLTQAIWNILMPRSLTPPPFRDTDADVIELNGALERWRDNRPR
jgi:hypothetical protein